MQQKLSIVALACLILTLGAPASALVPPEESPLADKELRHPGLEPEASFARLDQLGPVLAAELQRDLAVLGLGTEAAILDARSGRWATLWLARPMVPGSGVGNRLTWADLGFDSAPDTEAMAGAAWSQLMAFLERHREQLRIDPAQLDRRVGVHAGGQIIQIFGGRVVNGVPVRGAGLVATLNHGNLILLGMERWGAIDVSTAPALDAAAAIRRVEEHVAPLAPRGYREEPRLEMLPLGASGDPGSGYTHRLAWIVRPAFDGLNESYEAAVDAHGGELLAFRDTNHYQAAARNVKGGVYPVSNDGIPPGGVEIPGYPMPYADLTHAGGTATADAGGNVFGVTGDMTTALEGPFIRMNDNCGAISETSTEGDLDLGTSGGTDCTVPPGHSAGDTHSSRTGFFELNRIVEMALGHWPDPGPANTWLNSQLTSNMNINATCNAFWNGVTINFYREGGGCANTGELAGVFDHEWGHGIDDNGTNGGISSPGEGIPDVYAALRLNMSCIGRGFFTDGSLCGGYGDPCTPESGCTGVRDIDWENHASGLPHDVDWVNSNPNCGSSHCRGYVYSEAIWDLLKRDLPTIYGYDSNTAYEITNRLTYLGADNVSTWYTTSNPGEGGCGANSGYQQFLGVDDDNGDLNDGTPHMQALFSAYDRHQIACSTPVVQDSGCGGAPTQAPVVTAAPTNTGANLSWDAIPGATRYKIYRGDGEFQCDFGKAIVGETTSTSFADSGLQNGREYFYVVAGFNASDACMGPASLCANVVPVDFMVAQNSEDNICAGTDGVFTLTVNDIFTPPVDMSATGNPPPTTAGFVPDPLNGPLPQDTVLTIGNTAGVPFGSYVITATADDGFTVFSLDLTLNVFDAVPAAPTLISPPNGAIDVDLIPTLEWSPSTQGSTYDVELAADPAFNNIVFSDTTLNTSITLTSPLDPESTYYWRVRSSNACGTGADSVVFSFTTRPIPPILLVDDDDNTPDVRGIFTAALDALGETYDIWDTENSDNEPSFAEAAPYRKILWFTGDEFGGAAGPGAAGEAALASYLDAGGCLFLSSQDYHYDRGLTPFMQTYLGVASVTNDVGDYGAVSGVPGSIFEGMGPYSLDYAGPGLADWSDIVTPDGTALLALEGDNTNGAALQKEAGTYRTSFFVFPFAAISGATNQQEVLRTLLNFCGPEAQIFADGFESGDTSAWATVCPPNCGN